MPDQDTNPLIRIERQLERLDDLTRTLATREDLAALRKEVVQRDLLDPQLNALKAQIARIDQDRITDRIELEKRIDKLQDEQASRSDKLWMRIGPAIGVLGFLLALFEFLSHVRLTP